MIGKSNIKISTFSVYVIVLSKVFWSISLIANVPKSNNNPGARWGHVFIYDPVRDEVLLFGGSLNRGGPYLNDTWTWDGKSWQRHDVTSPPARGFAAATFHPIKGTIILHGGRGDDRKTYSDTWAWDGSAWHELEATGPFQSDHHQMVYVAHDTVILAFGGWNWHAQDVSGDTWIWNGEWIKASIPGPRKRGAFAMAYDGQEKRIVVFGGLWLDGQYADLWQWHGRSWKQIGGPYDNSSVDHHAMVYDSKRHQIIIFGGKNYRYRPLNNTMILRENKIHLITSEGPRPRHSLGLTFNSKLGLVLLYGGKEYLNDDQGALGDFWFWDGGKWQEIQ